MKKMSVVIPVYNVEQYLQKCLDSVVNQTLKDLEIICINDGSSDSSLAILYEYAKKDNRIIVLSQDNKGLSATRNRGIEIATGHYIGFVDSDDWLDLDFYEKLYNAAIKYEADIACGNLLRINVNKSTKNKCKNTYLVKYKRYKCTDNVRKKYLYADLPQNNYVMNRIYHRIKLQKSNVRFVEGMTFEDIEFSHKAIYYLEYLVTVPKTNYNYRNTDFSIVNTKSAKNSYYYKKAMNNALIFMQRNNLTITNIRKYGYEIKKEYSLFNIPLLTTRKYGETLRYYLFGKIYIGQQKVVNLYDKNQIF